jgi:hypothetical protein
MRKLYLIALVMALMLIGSAVVAQQPVSKLPWPPDTTGGGDECYWIFPPNRESPVTSILLNRCSGSTWMLRSARTPEGKVVWRWFPLHSDINEYAMQPTTREGPQ